jgi:sugar phosphate permease
MPEIETRTMAKVAWRLVPFLMLCYFIAYLDRVNIGFAGASMIKDLGLSASIFGGASGIFFIAYFFFEVPSNLALDRFGARIWIARIMITWGLVSAATALVSGNTSFFFVRFLLGVAEAGFVPGICYYLTLWFPNAWRGKAMVAFLVAVPISGVFGSPLSGALLGLEGVWGLHGWQWLFIIEGLPAVICGVACFGVLIDNPSKAGWLTGVERAWLSQTLERERARMQMQHSSSLLQVLTNGRVMTLALHYAAETIAEPSDSLTGAR